MFDFRVFRGSNYPKLKFLGPWSLQASVPDFFRFSGSYWVNGYELKPKPTTYLYSLTRTQTHTRKPILKTRKFGWNPICNPNPISSIFVFGFVPIYQIRTIGYISLEAWFTDVVRFLAHGFRSNLNCMSYFRLSYFTKNTVWQTSKSKLFAVNSLVLKTFSFKRISTLNIRATAHGSENEIYDKIRNSFRSDFWVSLLS